MNHAFVNRFLRGIATFTTPETLTHMTTGIKMELYKMQA